MIFRANQEQILQLVVNAINASQPVGAGYLHYEMKSYTIEDFMRSDRPVERFLNIDYFQGRAVKLYIEPRGCINSEESFYEIADNEPKIDYQTWVRCYPTYKDLIQSVDGIIIV